MNITKVERTMMYVNFGIPYDLGWVQDIAQW